MQPKLAAVNYRLPDRADGAAARGSKRHERLAAVRTPGLRFDGQLTAQGYADWIGCEDKPPDPADSSMSFGWREPDAV